MIDELQGRLQAMNPEPNGDPSPDELAAVFGLMEARRSSMDHHEARDTIPIETPRRAWRRPAMAFAGMALLALLLVGGGVLLVGGSDAPAPPATDAPPPTTQPSPATTQAAPATTQPSVSVTTTSTTPTSQEPFADFVTVERVSDESFGAGGTVLWDMTLGGPGIVAVGEIETPDDIDSNWGGPSRDAVIWVSTDGRIWDRVDDPELFGGDDWDELHAVWSSPTGLIAEGFDAGSTHPGDIEWYASSDGIDWALISDQDLFDAWERAGGRAGTAGTWFYEGGPGWVAVIDRDGEIDTVLVSAGGFEWEQTTEAAEDLIGPWSEVWPDSPMDPGPDAWDSGDSYYPWNLASDGDRVVAVRYHAEPKVGVSTDGGATWLQVAPEAFGDEWPLITIDVVQLDGLYVIGGAGDQGALLWILEWNDAEEEP